MQAFEENVIILTDKRKQKSALFWYISGSDWSQVNSCPSGSSLIMEHYTYCQKDISHSGWIYEAENEPTLMAPLLFGPNSIWWRPKGEMANTWISRSLSQENWPSITLTQLQCQQKWVLPIIMMIRTQISLKLRHEWKMFVLVSSKHIFGNKVNLAMKAIVVKKSNFQVSGFKIQHFLL